MQFIAADLRTWSPDGQRWDLVTSQFMHQPSGGMLSIVTALGSAVAAGGTLLVVGHHPLDLDTGLRRGGPQEWFTAESLVPALDSQLWDISAETRARTVNGPEGEPITVHDAVLKATRRS